MEDIFLRKRALTLWQEGQRLQLEGDLDAAIDCYDQSIAVFPTAEAHTFRAWAYSFQNRLDDAIAGVQTRDRGRSHRSATPTTTSGRT